MTNKKRIGIAVPMWLYEELKAEAEYTGQTLSALILQIFRDWWRANVKHKDERERHG